MQRITSNKELQLTKNYKIQRITSCKELQFTKNYKLHRITSCNKLTNSQDFKVIERQRDKDRRKDIQNTDRQTE